jgi:succinate dehydrogenase / fumarate reductase, flavoprotein subunit
MPCDVLVIGAGAAGLRAAIAAHDEGASVIVLGKRGRVDAHTVLASGGINAALGTVDPDDWTCHFADTIREGYSLANPRAVERLVRDAPRAISELADWGCPFARLEDGRIDQRFFGAHTFRRTCYVGDYTGRAVLETLDRQVSQRGIRVVEGAYVSRLLVYDGRCFGALAFDVRSGVRTLVLARATVLATGGYTRLWRMSSSRADENTGDGIELALDAGCRIADMEQVQFHPTGMVVPEAVAGTLVTEAMRGEGARLFNANGERFMSRYDADRLELSSRDRVALANYTEIVEGRGGAHGGVFLDITHRSKEDIIDQLPRMYEQFMEHLGVDISRERVEVAPTAHYSMGGVQIDPERHETDVEGLFAAGEVTTGVHGANRLGGNSLTETMVFGRIAGRCAAGLARDTVVVPRDRKSIAAAHDDLDEQLRAGDVPAVDVAQRLREIMWENAGVVRHASSLARGLHRIAELAEAQPHLDTRPSDRGYVALAHALDLRASLTTAEATLRSALERRESRGAHQRSDHPELDPEARVNIVITRTSSNELHLESRSVAPLPESLRDLTALEIEPSSGDRLLE